MAGMVFISFVNCLFSFPLFFPCVFFLLKKITRTSTFSWAVRLAPWALFDSLLRCIPLVLVTFFNPSSLRFLSVSFILLCFIRCNIFSALCFPPCPLFTSCLRFLCWSHSCISYLDHSPCRFPSQVPHTPFLYCISCLPFLCWSRSYGSIGSQASNYKHNL